MSPMYERNRCEISVLSVQERTRLTASMRRNFFTIWNIGDRVLRISFTVQLFAYMDMRYFSARGAVNLC
jgi:hypothetical protein